MMSFDLLKEPWIPVVDMVSGQMREAGLYEVLVRAHAIREVHGDTPLETIAINRLLLAIWLRIFGSQTSRKTGWLPLWGQRIQGFNVEQIGQIEEYVSSEPVRDRFDLLHPIHPFYQATWLPEYLGYAGTPAPISRIFSEEASGNNPTLFSHQLDSGLREVRLAKAARGIVTTHAAALQGGRSRPFYFSDAPVVSGAVFWLRGESLFEALLLNAPPDHRCRMGAPDDQDRPAWEAHDVVEAKERGLNGYLDYLTFQARRILLAVRESANGEAVATGVWISQGDKIAGGVDDDPLMAYRAVEQSERGCLPLRLRVERALWRDSSVFLNLVPQLRNNSIEHAPRTFEWVAASLDRQQWTVDVFGVINNKGAIETWRHERMPAITAYLTDPALYGQLQNALALAEEQRKNLIYACNVAAATLLFPAREYRDLQRTERQRVRVLAISFGVEGRYWSSLELPFLGLLHRLPEAKREGRLEHEERGWEVLLRRLARGAYRDTMAVLEQGARNLQALARGIREL